MFKRKYSVSILDEKWSVLISDVRLNFIPRENELIYIDENKKYFIVLNVIHYLNKKQGIFLIVKEFSNEFIVSKKIN